MFTDVGHWRSTLVITITVAAATSVTDVGGGFTDVGTMCWKASKLVDVWRQYRLWMLSVILS